MLRIMDRYAFKVQTKGSYYHFNSKKLVFTTNIDPLDWYPNVDDRAPFMRRLKDFAQIYDFDPMRRNRDGTPEPIFLPRDMTQIRVI